MFLTESSHSFSENMFHCGICLFVGFLGVCAGSEQVVDETYTRDQLQPLTKFRQQHRRTVDGRLCAAAFVQNRKAYTGCTEAPNPSGESGQPWCYVEAQVIMIYLSTDMKFWCGRVSSWINHLPGIIAVGFD